MLLETFLVVGSCHDKPSTADRVLHLAHEFRVFRNLETWIEFCKFPFVFFPSLWVVNKGTIENALICLLLRNCLFAGANRFADSDLFLCLRMSSWVHKITRALCLGWGIT